jgi:hypothetical protein
MEEVIGSIPIRSTNSFQFKISSLPTTSEPENLSEWGKVRSHTELRVSDSTLLLPPCASELRLKEHIPRSSAAQVAFLAPPSAPEIIWLKTEQIACQGQELLIPAPDKQIRVAHELSPILYP